MIAKPSEIFWRIIDWYQIAKLKGQITFWIVFAIAVYLPFEEFILKWTPAPSIVLLFLRFLHEFVIYFLLLKVFYKRLVNGDRLIKSSIELAFICFFFWAIILLFVHDTSIFSGLNNLRTLIRYVAVYYIIVELDLSRQQINLLLKTILILGLIQGYLVTIQYFAPQSFNDLFIPKDVNLDAGGIAIQKDSEVSAGNLKSGSVNGTFANTTNTSSFLVLCFIIWVILSLQNFANTSLIKNFFNLLIMYFALFATYKRVALMFGLVIPIVVLFFYRKKLLASKIIWLYMFGAFMLVFGSLFFLNVDTSINGWAIRNGEEIDLLGYFGQIFSSRYWEKGTRQWMIITIFQGIIGTGNWFGLSPDSNEAINTLAELVPSKQSLILERKGVFEDVYWGAMLIYYGIPGVALFGYIFHRLYKTTQWLIDYCLDSQIRTLAIVFATLIVISIFYGFVERIFEIKCFSFYLWLLAGVVVNVYSSYWRKSEKYMI
ncbi:MAG: hypothetical protein QNJ32_10670 [Xenococcaceae cyanobacterium MO_167.B27]|nr:hypothetical protein [Xenococcaceae cyanobacterium MO_167.B27]